MFHTPPPRGPRRVRFVARFVAVVSASSMLRLRRVRASARPRVMERVSFTRARDFLHITTLPP